MNTLQGKLCLTTILAKETNFYRQIFWDKKYSLGNSLVVQWLSLGAHCGGTGSIPGVGTKILKNTWCSQTKSKKRRLGKTIFIEYENRHVILEIFTFLIFLWINYLFPSGHFHSLRMYCHVIYHFLNVSLLTLFVGQSQ